MREAAGLVAGGAILAVTALTYDGCDRLGLTPYALFALAVVVAALVGAAAAPARGERVQSSAFAGVVVALAGVVVLMILFAADSCTGA